MTTIVESLASKALKLLAYGQEHSALPVSTGPLTIDSVLHTVPVSTMTSVVLDQAATYNNRSGAFTLGGTAQQLLPADPNRRYLFILNPISATESLWVDMDPSGGLAVINGEDTGSIELRPGQSLEFFGGCVPTNKVTIICASTGHKFTAYDSHF